MGLCTLRRVRMVAATLAVACALAACGKREEPPAGAPAPAAKAPARLTAPEPAAPPAPVPPAAAPAPQAAPAPAAPPPIGKVDSLEGEVRLTRAGVERAVQAAMTLEQGDALKSGPQSWALLAMVDGATVTIRPDTEMRLDAYRYVPDGNPGDNTANWSLVRGALRSITGLIGKSNPPGYQVKTPTATIGIRGTDHEPAYYPPPAPGEKADHPPGTYDKVNSGEAVLRSARGTIPVRKGQTAFANVEAQTKPQILARPPAFYQRQAEVDRRVAPRREQFHKDYEQERQKQLQVLRVQQQQKLQEVQKQRLEAAQKAQDERKAKGFEGQKQRLDAQKQQQEARKAEQDKRKAEQQQKKSDQKADQKKSDQKADQKKADQKADQRKSDQKKGDEKKARDKSAGVALPPSVADRVRNMQRGDKAAPGSAARREAAPERDAQAGQKAQAQGQSQRAQPQAAQSQRAQPQAQKGQQQQASPFQALPQALQPQQQKAQSQQQRPQAPQQQQDRRQQQQQQRDPRKADKQER